MGTIKFQRAGQAAKYLPGVQNYNGYLVREHKKGVGNPIPKSGFNAFEEGEVWEEFKSYQKVYMPFFDSEKITPQEKEMIKKNNYDDIEDVIKDGLQQTLLKFECNERYSITEYVRGKGEVHIKEAGTRPPIDELFIFNAGVIYARAGNKMLHSLGAEIGREIVIWTTVYAGEIPEARSTNNLAAEAKDYGFVLDSENNLVASFSEEQAQKLVEFLLKYDVKIWPETLGMVCCWECGSYFKPKKRRYRWSGILLWMLNQNYVMINYNQYPSLLFLSYNKDNAPEELPFEVHSSEVSSYLAQSAGYGQMFAIIASLNSQGFSPTHYWLNNKNFKDVEYNDNFRNAHFKKFVLSDPKEPKYGCICFKDGGQYVYLYLSPDIAKIKGVKGVYLCTALFRENVFIGFEEAVIHNGFSVMPTGYYAGGMDIGGYLSFVSICLSFFLDASKEVGTGINTTAEKILTK